MKKGILVILVLLILISSYFVFFHKSSTIDESTFNLKDTSNITQIVVSDQVTKVEISKLSGQWMVNTNYHANQFLVKQILRIFKNIELSALVSDNQSDSTIEFLKKKGIRLQFIKNESVIKELWIGNFNSGTKSTLLMNENEIAAYVSAPGFGNNIRKFIEADPMFWRDKLIFSINPENIETVEIHDFKNEENSFQIKKEGTKYRLFNKMGNEINFDENKLLLYLSYFSNISFESLAKDLSKSQQDSLIKQHPIYAIQIVAKGSQSINLTIYPKKANNESNGTDLNFVYGNLNNEKLIVLISYFQIDPILKGIGYFKAGTN